MLIFITGYMGSGKTTLGKKLAERLNYHFYDLDELIEQQAGKSLIDIFKESGEDGFRKMEREVLLVHLEDTDTIIATGGGTACYADNMELMNQNGVTIFLDTPLETIIERLKAEKKERPLLKGIPEEKLADFVRLHLAGRRKFYEQARIRVENFECEVLYDAVRSSKVGR